MLTVCNRLPFALQLDDEDSNDVEVSWTDQQKINEFSRLNQRQTDAQAELDALRTEKEQVDEVYEEVQLLELSEDFDDDLGGDESDDDDGHLDEDRESGKKNDGAATVKGNMIPFKIGDAFAHVPLERATGLLEQEQSRLDREIEAAQDRVRTCEEGMKKLKVDLYAKFGSNISEWIRQATASHSSDICLRGRHNVCSQISSAINTTFRPSTGGAAVHYLHA